jgi:hypothetical protein
VVPLRNSVFRFFKGETHAPNTRIRHLQKPTSSRVPDRPEKLVVAQTAVYEQPIMTNFTLQAKRNPGEGR